GAAPRHRRPRLPRLDARTYDCASEFYLARPAPRRLARAPGGLVGDALRGESPRRRAHPGLPALSAPAARLKPQRRGCVTLRRISSVLPLWVTHEPARSDPPFRRSPARAPRPGTH